MEFRDLIKKRRSRYDLNYESTLETLEIEELLKAALLHTPTAYNAQGGRLLLALNEHHEKIWEIVWETLRPKLNDQQYVNTKEKVQNFKNAHGTVLFFNDQDTIENYQKKYPKYADKTDLWANQSQGMLQYVIWTAFTAADMGASLQHYNPLIDASIKEYFELPETWSLVAQMPFGVTTDEPKEKHFKPLDERFKVFK